MKVHGTRIFSMLIIFVIITMVFVVRLMSYQLVNGESYRAQSGKTIQSNDTVLAARGEILDRYGRRIATNRIGYTVTFNRSYLPTNKDSETIKQNDIILRTAKILKEDGEQWNDSLPITAVRPYQFTTTDKATMDQFWKIYKNYKVKKQQRIKPGMNAQDVMNQLLQIYNISGSVNDDDKRTLLGILYDMEVKGFSRDKPYQVASDVGITTVTKIEERSLELPGVEINQVPIRVYTDGTLAPHIVGVTGPIYAEQMEKYKNLGYALDDQIGEFGIEQAEEQYLHGQDGTRTIQLNRDGKVTNEVTTKQAVPGDTVVLTIDSDMQRVLQAVLPQTIQQVAAASGGNTMKGANAISGAAVALSVKTGEVLAMASYPSYDLNSYLKNYSALLKQKGNPLLDRCVQGTYRPGSTFKPVVATAGLYYGAITPSNTFSCPGYWIFEGHRFNCDEPHGTENVLGGIKDSCNVFFYHTGFLTGIDKIDTIATALGLGQKTGIEISGESSGVLSGKAEKATRGGGSWHDGDTLQSSIGQFDNKFTLLQLANYECTIINGGVRNQVHLVKKIVSYDGAKTIVDNTNPKVLSTFNLPKSVTSVVLQGMREVVEEGGTGSYVFRGYPMAVGGKTGTAEVPGGYNGVFVGYAPADDPQIAVAVVIEHGYHGNQTAPVAKAAFSQYFYSTNKVSGPAKDGTLIQ